MDISPRRSVPGQTGGILIDVVFRKQSALGEKIRESVFSVLPILIIVVVLCFFVTPVSTDLMLSFLIGTLLVILGMGLFSLGADTAMTPIGNRIGASLTKSRKIWLMLGVGFVLGASITIAEPDLQVLAETVPHIDNAVLLAAVGAGVGFFLVVCMLRILTGIRLRWLLIVFYAVVFVLAAFTDREFLGVAFDSGGVTTGPMTVPFILALGVGISNIRSDSKAEADSFGLVSLCSIGPVLAVLILGFFYNSSGTAADASVSSWADTLQIGRAYLGAIPKYLLEMSVALAPIVIIFLLFQLFSFRMQRRSLLKIFSGIIYTYAGLVLFLTGVNVGFSPLGSVLGSELAAGPTRYILIPLSMLFGWFIISAEPAVKVLEKQIEDVSAGAISGKAVKLSLSIAIALANGLAMLRVLTGVSILWFVIPGYAIALALSFFVPDIYTAIAFDSGGVASGPMTATFMLQFMIGVTSATGGDILSDAFGLVALVAMMPLITVQIMGFIFVRGKAGKPAPAVSYPDYEIIELWEEQT